MNTLVIARYKEDVSWANSIPGWRVVIYDKGAGQLPNWPGRDLHTHLHHIVTHYEELDGDVAFVQGNPFDHWPSLVRDLQDPTVRVYGRVEACDSNGMPRIANMWLNEYTIAMGLPIPSQWKFICGAQCRVTAAQILNRPKSLYESLLFHAKADPYSSWRLERLWHVILGIQI